jgi:hypothetical protein
LAADAGAPELVADVEKGELRDRGADVRHEDSDPNQPSVRERATCDSARGGVVHERLALRLDSVFAVSVRIPGGRGPTSSPGNELGAMLLEEDFDALGAVDLADARELAAR